MSRVTPPKRQAPAPPPLTTLWAGSIPGYVVSLAWAPDGTRLAVAAGEGPVELFDAATGAPIHHLAGHGLGTSTATWSPDGTTLATAGQDGLLRLWDPATGHERHALEGGAAWVEHLAWSSDSGLLASAAGRLLRLWTPEGGLVRSYPPAASTIAALGFRPRARVLATGGYGGLSLWSPNGDEPLDWLEWQGSVLALVWSPDGTRIASGEQARAVHYWIVDLDEELEMGGYATKVQELAWDPQSRLLATGGGSVILVWDCSGQGPQGTRPRALEGHEGALSVLAYQHQGPHLASGSEDGLLCLWRPHQGRRPLARLPQSAAVTALAWSPDDRRLAVGADDGTAQVLVLR